MSGWRCLTAQLGAAPPAGAVPNRTLAGTLPRANICGTPPPTTHGTNGIRHAIRD